MALLDFFRSDSLDPYGPTYDRKKIFIAAGLLAAVILGAIMLILSMGNGSRGAYMSMLARHDALQTTIDDSQKQIKSSALAKVNSDASLLLSSHGLALDEQLKSKFGESKLSDSATKEGDSIIAEITEKLSSASLLDKFDVTYRNIIQQQITLLMNESLDVKNQAGGKTFSADMDSYFNDLKSIDNQLNALSL
ncbi:MAG: hypothetical protein PVI21_03165 [Candidatus Woesebacteria bacterium]|jgi:hypothetical protein